jgi:6-pyruvoyl-tetrahydropterin synthase
MRVGLEGSVDCAHHLVGAGLCESPHGHTYVVQAEWDLPSGIAPDSQELFRNLNEVLGNYQKRDLNALYGYPSCECFCQDLFRTLAARTPQLSRMKVWEGQAKWAEVDRRDPWEFSTP